MQRMKYRILVIFILLLSALAQAQNPRVTLWTGFDQLILKYAALTNTVAVSGANLELRLADNQKTGLLETGQIAGRFDTVVLSWNAVTPDKTSLQIEARAKVAGVWTKYYKIALWTTDTSLEKQSFSAQADQFGQVETDTLKLKAFAEALQIKVIFSSIKTGISPSLFGLAAVMSDSTQHQNVLPKSLDKTAWGLDLPVPARSQMIYPNGGSVWCSPTSTTMLLEYWSAKLGRKLSDSVPTAARAVWDTTYDGAGNWSFNMAYAGSKGLRAYVHRLSSLAQAQKYIAQGIPLALSIAWKLGALDGAALPSSNGHLVVLRGFTATGDPIINDPAAATDAAVRRVYKRAQLEKIWIEASGGIVYLIEAAK